ncbi:TIGR02597 family protein [Cerasicoccus fimbriatus]|uniref:TIGR02597 family protein n=1 Tax=Cerasicoccus fimbriatus TaxID=3014554 RepID=UPI0022B5D144|nr:TIGR02597 family protein [Cerasicoccus sp. TK19100]
MKISPYLAFLAASSLAITANAATTDPMGGMVIPVKGESDTRISVPFSRAVTFEGRIDSISGSTLTILGSPSWDDGEFLYGDADSSDPANTYYAVFLTGAKEGLALEITANDANSITVALGDEDLTGVTSESADGSGNGDIIQIVPYWTPATLFSGTTVPEGSILYRYINSGNAVNRSAADVLTYFDGYGWYDNGGNLSDDDTLDIAEGVIIRTPAGSSDFDLILSGAVPMFKTRYIFSTDDSGQSNDIIFSVYTPVDVSIGDSGLGGVADQAILYAYNNDSADYNKSASSVLTYFEGYGWYDNGGNLVDNTFQLEPGQNYILRKPGTVSNDSFVWSYLPSYLE